MINEVNTSAEQVLFKIENKIVGRDLQNTESISIEKQVDMLIKAATNENNLAVMFHGWGAWLYTCLFQTVRRNQFFMDKLASYCKRALRMEHHLSKPIIIRQLLTRIDPI